MSGAAPHGTGPGKGVASDPADERVQALSKEVSLLERKLAGVEAISRALGHEHNLERILDAVMDHTTELLDAERSTLFLLGADGRTLWSRYTRGGEVATIEVEVGMGLAGWVALHGRAINVKNAYKDPRFDATFDDRTGFRTSSVLCSPLLDSRQKVLGVIQVLNSKRGYFTPADADLIEAIAAPAAIAIHNSHLYLDVVDKNIHLQETSERLQERTSELELLFRIERAAATSTTIEAAAEGALEAVLEELPSQVAAVVLHDEDGDGDGRRSYASALGPEASRLLDGPAYLELDPPLDSPTDTVSLGGRRDAGTRVARLPADPSWAIRQFASVPLTHQDEVLGSLQLVNPRSGEAYDLQEMRVLEVVGARLGMAVALARALEEEHQATRLASIGQALSGVMHDLKTPLTIISGYARLMATSDEREVREGHRERVRGQVALIKDMTQELLAFARGDSEILLQKVFLGAYMKEIGEHLEGEFADSGVALGVRCEGDGGLRVDPNKLKRAVFNLARNGKEALADGSGNVTLVARIDDGSLVLTVHDDGPGIPPEMEGRLFDSFATHGKDNGTGLGLAIVKKVVEAHGGTIEVASSAESGTTFTITIPT